MAAVLCDVFGATGDELARFFDVSPRTVDEWTSVHPEFSRSRTRAREEADKHVEARLYRRAMGYSHPAVKVLQYEGQPVIVPYTEHYPPDPKAIEFWLKNRQPDRWREKVEIEHGATSDFAAALAGARKRKAAA